MPTEMKSAFQTPLTVSEVISLIDTKHYYLPAIQREFVWDVEKISKLFDSLMKDYTIGSFLLWRVSKEKVREFQFYDFIREYHERDNYHNPKARVPTNEEVTAVLDGQQRLTALYIGLKGTYTYKMRNKRWQNVDAFPKRALCLNLLSESDAESMKYEFRFLTIDEMVEKTNREFWFPISRILDFENLNNVNTFLRDKDLLKSEFACDCLFKLWEVITSNRVINYYLETSQELDKVLNIFIRVNNGGTQLSYSDLLLSTATARWKNKDAREEINSFVDEINKIGEGFEFDKDFVLKSCLVLSDELTDIHFKADNFTIQNMAIIEKNWGNIMMSLQHAITLISSFGYSGNNLTSNNAVIPIAYYILKKGNPKNFVLANSFRDDRAQIKKWFMASLLKGLFGGSSDAILKDIRGIIHRKNNLFPFSDIIAKYKGTNKSLAFTDDDIEALSYLKYGHNRIFSALALLYPTLDFRNRFHQDHIFPKSYFTTSKLRAEDISGDKKKFYLEHYNYIGNIQLLEGLPNEEKSNMDFKEWINKIFKTAEERKDYMEKHYIPMGVPLDFIHFDRFMTERNKLLAKKLKDSISTVDNSTKMKS